MSQSGEQRSPSPLSGPQHSALSETADNECQTCFGTGTCRKCCEAS